MHEIKHAVGSVVASDTQASVAALDNALVTQSRMCASIVEAAADSRLPIAATQSLLENLAHGINGLATSRGNMVVAVRELTRIQARSNLETTSFGCPGGLEGSRTSGSLELTD